MLDLKGKIAFVAGAGSVGPGWGNGKATAVLLARQGAQVFATDLKEAAANETRALIEKEGGVCAVQQCNMTDAGEVRAAVDACVKRFGRIDILVNNCGGSAAGDPVSMSEEVWDAQLDLNLKTAFMPAGCSNSSPFNVFVYSTPVTRLPLGSFRTFVTQVLVRNSKFGFFMAIGITVMCGLPLAFASQPKRWQ